MVTKTVALSNGTSFAQIGEAQEFFRTILRAKAVGIDLNEAEFEMVTALYKDYCSATSWPIPHEISGIGRGVETRVWKNGTIRTECFVVRFGDGSEHPFSFLKACSAIARPSRPVGQK